MDASSHLLVQTAVSRGSLTPRDFEEITHFQWCHFVNTWWRHQMETFSALLAICAGNSPVPGELPAQRPVTRSFDVSFDLRPHKRLSEQWWDWWYETLSCPLWRHGNDKLSLHWRHNERDCVSNHRTHECLLNRFFRRRSKKTSKLRATGLCEGN